MGARAVISERFDGRAAWAQLTPEEQAEIGSLALRSTHLMLMAGEVPLMSDAFDRLTRLADGAERDLDNAVEDALRRLGVVDEDMFFEIAGLA